MKDLTTEEDIKTLVDNFYEKVNKDTLLAPFFNQHTHVNWESHLPKMYDFWSSILFGSMKYHGLPFPKHAALPPMQKSHFDQWLALFSQTVDENFSGEKADEAKTRAGLIARTFQYKLGIVS